MAVWADEVISWWWLVLYHTEASPPALLLFFNSILLKVFQSLMADLLPLSSIHCTGFPVPDTMLQALRVAFNTILVPLVLPPPPPWTMALDEFSIEQ